LLKLFILYKHIEIINIYIYIYNNYSTYFGYNFNDLIFPIYSKIWWTIGSEANVDIFVAFKKEININNKIKW